MHALAFVQGHFFVCAIAAAFWYYPQIAIEISLSYFDHC